MFAFNIREHYGNIAKMNRNVDLTQSDKWLFKFVYKDFYADG